MTITMQFIEKAVELRGSQVINGKTYKRVVWRRRLMAFATFLTMSSILLLLLAIALPAWSTIDFINTDNDHIHVQLGIWGEYRTVNSSVETAEWIPHFPEPPGAKYMRLAGADLKHYYRAQAAFCIISLVFMVCNNLLALYTFTHHRYMYKRLVAIFHIVIAMCIVVTIEVLLNSVNEWNMQVAKNAVWADWDYSASQKTGIPVYIAWIIVFIHVFAAFCFANASHKQKGSRAATAEFEIEDRPVHIGRR